MKRILLSIFCLFLVQGAVQAQGITWIDLSYKVVLNPANGLRPSGVTDADIDAAIEEMNQLQEAYFRGYRFRRVDPIRNVGGINQFNTGPSRWYNTNFFDRNNGSAWKDQMEAEAEANNNLYRWNNNAINLYITNGICGGICSFPGGGDDIIIIGRCSDADGALQLHEIGHYFDLCHTQGCPCGNCDPDESGQCHTTPGNDDIGDTLPDLQCWDRDNIAQNSYGTNYNNLNSAQRKLVDDVFLNIMSYRSLNIISRITERQIDHWSDVAKLNRQQVIDRNSFFVSKSSIFVEIGTSIFPYNRVIEGVNASNSGDVIVVKPGAYNETMTINKPLSIRATRQGTVTIGSSSSSLTSEEEATIMAEAQGIDEERNRIQDSYVSIGEEPYLGFAGESFPVGDVLTDPDLIEDFDVFPNPNHGVFSVNLEEKLVKENPDARLVIYSAQGEVVYETQLNGAHHVDVNLLARPKGTYYVKIISSHAEVNIKTLFYQ